MGMRTAIALAVLSCLAAAGARAGAGLDGTVAPRRAAELVHLLRHDCGSCHGMTLKGGLGPALLPSTLAGKDDQALTDTIRGGAPGTPMPPWGFALTETEALWLVRLLKEGLDAH